MMTMTYIAAGAVLGFISYCAGALMLINGTNIQEDRHADSTIFKVLCLAAITLQIIALGLAWLIGSLS